MDQTTTAIANDESRNDYCMYCEAVCGHEDHAGDIGVVNAISLIHGDSNIKKSLAVIKTQECTGVEMDRLVRTLTIRYALPIPQAFVFSKEGTWNYLSGFASVVRNNIRK